MQQKDLPPLEPYQREAINFILSHFNISKDENINTLCALDVGMGKTRVACEILARLFNINAGISVQGYALVCCPTIGIMESIWADTLDAYGLKKIILEGEELKIIKMERKKIFTIPPLTICLITYANLINGDNINYFINNPPNILIFDEYHTLTNNSLNMNKKCRDTVLKLPIRLRIGLTATPFVNNEMEAVPAFGILNNKDLIEKFRLANNNERKSLVQEVKNKNFLFYRENLLNYISSEWVISIPIGKELYSQYLLVKKVIGNNKLLSQHQINKLSVSPLLVDKKTGIRLNQSIETGKIKALRAIILRLPENDKIVICDNHKETLNFIKTLEFIRPLRPVLYLGGKKSANKKNIDSFNNNPNYRILLTTRQAGGEGLNLQVANHIVLINCWYTVKDIIQIIGRIKRKGQKKPVYAYIFGYNLFDCLEHGKELKSYILQEDEAIYRMIKKKKEIYSEWGMSVETKLPPLQSFFNYDSFEKEFNEFLDKTMYKEMPTITYNNLNRGITYKSEKYYDDEEDEEDEEGRYEESYLDELTSQYEEHKKCNNIQNQNIRKKIIVTKRKR